MNTSRVDPPHHEKPFYDGQGYLRIPGDDYYDEDGNLHKTNPQDEPDTKCENQPDQMKPVSRSLVTDITLTVTLKSEL